MMQEEQVDVKNGWTMLPLVIIAWLLLPLMVFCLAITNSPIFIVPLVLLLPFDIIFMLGLFTLQPKEARVLVLFGKYVGTVRRDGFHWANPFSVHRGSLTSIQEKPNQPPIVVRAKNKYVISLRSRNFETDTLKVNDQRGNPIEIRAVVVWRVENTAQATFEVDDYEHYVKVQSETAVRHLATSYPYDHSNDEPSKELTLRDSSDTINAALQQELQDRLEKAGVVVEEARLTHLAYSPEIAGAMLRRQQAEAIIAARQKIVHGAVSMVEMALTELSEKQVIELDEERKAAMVGNLLVILCGETQASPVINTGTLYH
ncbi:MAG: SPFH domain-containing protein [Planctomycetes bacterium]|nr:SPFH domain-containing protein [Planctomycetota bacterium]